MNFELQKLKKKKQENTWRSDNGEKKTWMQISKQQMVWRLKEKHPQNVQGTFTNAALLHNSKESHMQLFNTYRFVLTFYSH